MMHLGLGDDPWRSLKISGVYEAGRGGRRYGRGDRLARPCQPLDIHVTNIT